MRDHPELDTALLSAYFAEDASPETRAAMLAWVGDDPRRQRWMAQFEAVIRANRIEDAPRLDVDGLVEAVAARTRGEASPLERHPSPGRPAGARSPWAPSARGTRMVWFSAAGVLVLMLGVFLFRFERATPRVQHFQTALGQQASVTLPGGATMVMAPATSATVTPDGVELTGEGYFTVPSRTSQPFVVKTGNAVVQVLGTRFGVRQYAGESNSRVVVEDGRVALSASKASRGNNTHDARTVVAARMLAVISDSGVTVSSGIATREFTGWTHGLLEFGHVALRDVVTELIRAYGVDIQVPDTTLAAQTVSLEVSVKDDTLGEILGALCGVLDAHVVRRDRSFVIAPGRAVPSSRPTVAPHRSLPQPEKQYGR